MCPGRCVIEKTPFFILAVVSSVVTFLVQTAGRRRFAAGRPAALGASWQCPHFLRSLSGEDSSGRRAFPCSIPHPGHWPVWQIAGAALLLAAITALVLWRARAQPYLAVGWFWFLGMLAPAIGLVQVGIQSMADRYSYLPTVGISIMVVWGACECLAQRPGAKWILGTAAALAIAACMVLTPRQALYWRDSDTLFQHAIQVTKNNYLAYNNLGYFLSNRGEPGEGHAVLQERPANQSQSTMRRTITSVIRWPHWAVTRRRPTNTSRL